MKLRNRLQRVGAARAAQAVGLGRVVGCVVVAARVLLSEQHAELDEPFCGPVTGRTATSTVIAADFDARARVDGLCGRFGDPTL